MKIKTLILVVFLYGFYGMTYAQTEGDWKSNFDKITVYTSNKFIVYQKGKVGIVDKNGSVIIPVDYQSLRPFRGSDNVTAVKKNGKWGLIKNDKTFIYECVFEEITIFDEKRLTVRKNGLFGLISIIGETIIPIEYQNLKRYSYEGKEIVIAMKNNTWRLMYSDGTPITEFEYDNIKKFKRGKSVVEKGGIFGVINLNGELTVPLEFEKINDFRYQIASAKKNDKWGIIKNDGTVLLDFKYDEIRRSYSDFIEIRKGDFWGLINSEGKIIVPVEYDGTRNLDYGFFIIQKGDLLGVIRKGEKFLPVEYSEISLGSNRRLVRTLKKDAPKPKSNAPRPPSPPTPMMEIYIYAKKGQQFEIYDSRKNLLNAFDTAGKFKRGIAIATKGGEEVYINKRGDVLGKVE